ncbi:MAG TPA: hypothetical protein GXZ89_01010 [Fastidiosipila sp.]|nr:hypothetical protein [Fastidiosipila sp.]
MTFKKCICLIVLSLVLLIASFSGEVALATAQMEKPEDEIWNASMELFPSDLILEATSLDGSFAYSLVGEDNYPIFFTSQTSETISPAILGGTISFAAFDEVPYYMAFIAADRLLPFRPVEAETEQYHTLWKQQFVHPKNQVFELNERYYLDVESLNREYTISVRPFIALPATEAFPKISNYFTSGVDLQEDDAKSQIEYYESIDVLEATPSPEHVQDLLLNQPIDVIPPGKFSQKWAPFHFAGMLLPDSLDLDTFAERMISKVPVDEREIELRGNAGSELPLHYYAKNDETSHFFMNEALVKDSYSSVFVLFNDEWYSFDGKDSQTFLMKDGDLIDLPITLQLPEEPGIYPIYVVTNHFFVNQTEDGGQAPSGVLCDLVFVEK